MSESLLLKYPLLEDTLETFDGEMCLAGYGVGMYFDVADLDDEDAGSWHDPTANLSLAVSLRYLDVGTDPIEVGYSSDGVNETLETIVTKTDTGAWKWKHYALSNTARVDHTLHENFGNADFRLLCASDLILSNVSLKNRTTKAHADWKARAAHPSDVEGGAIQDATITATQIANATITATQIANATITATQIANATITATQIANATIQGSNIANATIAGGNLVNGTITATQIAAGTITANEIANATITSAKIGAGQITSANIAAGTIAAANIAAGAITANEIQDLTITASEIANLTITAGQIAAATITGAKIANATISGANIQSATITGSNLAGGTITGSNIAGSTVTGANIANSTITDALIAGATITGAKIAGATITGSNIAAGTITATNIAAGTITATQIAAGAVTADRISVSSLAAISASIGSATINDVLSIGSSGGIWQGSSGSFGSPNTGWKLYNASSNGVMEWWNGGYKVVEITKDAITLDYQAATAPTWQIRIKHTAAEGTRYADLFMDNTSEGIGKFHIKVAGKDYQFSGGGAPGLSLPSGTDLYLPSGGKVYVSGTKVVENRKTGWGSPTGTTTRTAFATSTVTTTQLAERVKALIDDLIAHGLIGT